MTLEDAKKLFELQEEEGCSVMIDGGYTDGFAEIGKLDGEYVYSSDVFSHQPLSEIDLKDVKVFSYADEWDEYLFSKKEREET